jgi:S1-C subfamily serine protease
VAAALVAFLAVFITARVLAGPNALLRPSTDSSGPQFIPTNPFTGNGQTRSPSEAATPEAAAIAAKVQPGVVDLNTQLAYQNATASGTGMVITPSGRILTNNHVVEGATSITATVVDTGRTYTATVVGTDPTDDIAVLQLTGASNLDTVPIGTSSTVEIGDQVVSLGNAGGLGGAPSIKTGTVEDLGQTITVGDQARGGFQELRNVIVTTTPLQSGDSGGPLANADGEVIGVDTAATVNTRYRAGQALGFSIPIDDAMAIVRQIDSGVATDTVHIGPTAFLGVTLLAGGGPGVVVSSVASDSPAESAGLEPGDIITSAGGQTVNSADGLGALIRSHRPGDKLSLKWTDPSGDDHTATVKLVDGPAG